MMDLVLSFEKSHICKRTCSILVKCWCGYTLRESRRNSFVRTPVLGQGLDHKYTKQRPIGSSTIYNDNTFTIGFHLIHRLHLDSLAYAKSTKRLN